MKKAEIFATVNPLHNPDRGAAALEYALSLVQDMKDRAAEAKIHWNLLVLNLFSKGDFQTAVAHGEISLAIARELNLREQMAYATNDLALGYWFTGQMDKALEHRSEACELWREIGNMAMLVDGMSGMAHMNFSVGNYDKTFQYSEEAYQIAQTIGNPWGQADACLLVGHAYFDRGMVGKAIETMERASRFGDQSGYAGAMIGPRADLGWIYGILGDVDHGLELAHQGLINAQERYEVVQGWPESVIAWLHLMKNELGEAAKWAQAAADHRRPGSMVLTNFWTGLANAEVARQKGDLEGAITWVDETIASNYRRWNIHIFIPDALHLKAKALLSLGKPQEAQAVLQAARAESEALGARRSLWPILMTLSELAAQNGNLDEAKTLRQQARENVCYIADHIGSPHLRESFLATPPVRAAMND